MRVFLLTLGTRGDFELFFSLGCELRRRGHSVLLGSSHFYADRVEAALPRAWVLSAPVWLYRAVVLLWLVWLLPALQRWLRSAWTTFGTGGFWKKRRAAEA